MLEQAVELAKAGDKDSARALLRQVIVEDPHNEQAWGWLAFCAKTKEERIAALERVVEINPDNEQAWKALDKQRVKQASASRQITEQPREPPVVIVQEVAIEPPKKRGCMRTLGYAFVIILILAVLGSLFGSNDSNENSKSEVRAPSAIRAWSACRDYVRANLKAPSTAKFPSYSNEFVREHANGNWRVSAWVDAQNAFGAMIRANFICILTYDRTNGDWNLEDIMIVEL